MPQNCPGGTSQKKHPVPWQGEAEGVLRHDRHQGEADGRPEGGAGAGEQERLGDLAQVELTNCQASAVRQLRERFVQSEII